MIVTTHIPLRDWNEIGPAARQDEADGFDAISFPEIRHDPFMAAALAAMATERIGLPALTSTNTPSSRPTVATGVRSRNTSKPSLPSYSVLLMAIAVEP